MYGIFQTYLLYQPTDTTHYLSHTELIRVMSSEHHGISNNPQLTSLFNSLLENFKLLVFFLGESTNDQWILLTSGQ